MVSDHPAWDRRVAGEMFNNFAEAELKERGSGPLAADLTRQYNDALAEALDLSAESLESNNGGKLDEEKSEKSAAAMDKATKLRHQLERMLSDEEETY